MKDTTDLVGCEEESSINQDTPDKDIGEDASDKRILMPDHDGPIPVNRHKGPSQRSRDDRRVDQASILVVAEVQRGEVDEVDDEDELCPDEVTSYKQHHEGEVKKVVENEVAAARASCVLLLHVGREEVSNIAKLGDEQNDPVDVHKHYVQCESGGIQVILAANGVTQVFAIVGALEAIVDGRDDGEKPRQDCQDLVGND